MNIRIKYMNHGFMVVCVCWTGFCMLPSSIFPPLCHRLHFKIPLLRSTCPEDSGWVGKWKGVEWRGSEFDTRPKSQRIISYPLSFEISSLDKISYMWMKADFQHTYTAYERLFILGCGYQKILWTRITIQQCARSYRKKTY